MRSILFATTVAALAASPAFACDVASPVMHTHMGATLSLAAATAADTAQVDAARALLRDLWIGHVFWVRNVVVAEIAGDKDAAAAAEQQVVRNAQDIAAAIEPFYGKEAREKLFTLLAGHYGAVKDILAADITKSPDQEKAAIDKLLANAGEIATFLSGANPNLPKDAVLGLLQAHAGHHIGQIQQLIAKDYAGELQTWADMTQHMYVIADALAGAIAKQFPEKFKA